MEIAVERLVALAFGLVGLSHLLAPATWAQLFEKMRAQGNLAGLLNAAMQLPLGLMIVAFHNRWEWPAAVVTILGWALLLKSGSHLLFPRLAQRSLALAGEGIVAEQRCRLAGFLMLALAIWVGGIALG